MPAKNSDTGEDFDVRTIKWKLKRGKVAREDLDDHLNDLPDTADKAESISTAFPGADESDGRGDAGDSGG